MHGLKKSSIKSFRHGDQSRRPQPDRTVAKTVGHNDLLATHALDSVAWATKQQAAATPAGD